MATQKKGRTSQDKHNTYLQITSSLRLGSPQSTADRKQKLFRDIYNAAKGDDTAADRYFEERRVKQAEAERKQAELQTALANTSNNISIGKLVSDKFSDTKPEPLTHEIKPVAKAEDIGIAPKLAENAAKERKPKKESEIGVIKPVKGYSGVGKKALNYGAKNAYAGLSSWNNLLFNTLDFIVPDVVQGKYDPIKKAKSYYNKENERITAEADKAVEDIGGGTAAQIGAQIIRSSVQAAPDAILAMLSMGASEGASAIERGITIGSSLGAAPKMGTWGAKLAGARSTAQAMIKNPSFWSSFMQEAGNDYEEAKERGASEMQATLYGMTAGLLNAGVEIGGGIQELPKRLQTSKGFKNAAWDWVKSNLEEGGEEVVQGTVSNALAKLIYEPDMKTLSMSADENDAALFNPVKSAKEGAMGFAVGAVLGSGQLATIKGINAAMNHNGGNTVKRIGRLMGKDTEVVNGLVETALTLDEDSDAHRYGKLMKEKIDNGGKATNSEIGTLTLLNEQELTNKQTAPKERTTNNIPKTVQENTVTQNPDVDDEISEIQQSGGIKQYSGDNKNIARIDSQLIAQGVNDTDRSVIISSLENIEKTKISTSTTAAADTITAAQNAAGKVSNVIADTASRTGRTNGSERISSPITTDEKFKLVSANVRMVANDTVSAEDIAAYAEAYASALTQSDPAEYSVLKQSESSPAAVLTEYMVNGTIPKGIIDTEAVRRNSGALAGIISEAVKSMAPVRSGLYGGSSVLASQAERMDNNDFSFLNSISNANAAPVAEQTSNTAEVAPRVPLMTVGADGSVEMADNTIMPSNTANAKAAQASDVLADASETVRFDEVRDEDKIPGLLVDEYTEALSSEERTTLDIIGTRLGVPIKIVESINANPETGERVPNGANGVYYNGVIYISIEAENKPMIVMSHEITHHMATNAKAEFKLYRDHVLNVIANANNTDAQSIVDDKINAYKRQGIELNYDEAAEEIAADYTKEFISDTDSAVRFINSIENPQVRKGIISRLVEAIRNILNKLRSAFRRVPQEVVDLHNAQALFADMAKATVENMGAVSEAEPRMRYSANETNIDKYAYNKLIGKPDMTVIKLTKQIPYKENGKINRSDVVDIAMRSLPDGASVYVKDIDRRVSVTRDALRHGLNRNSENTAFVTMHIGDILENAIRINDLEPRSNTNGGYVLMGAGVDNNGEYYPVRIIVNGGSIESVEALDKVYAIKAKKNSQSPNGAGFSPNGVPLSKGYSTISIADFLDIVKNNFADTLPQNVLDKYDVQRPKSALSNSVKFSVSEPVEETEDLIAVHNLSEDKLRSAFELGGFAMPSIAVTKADMGHDKFGGITLLFDKNTIDPQANNANKVYGGDAYTPTFPQIEYEASVMKADELGAMYDNISEKFGYDAARPLYNFSDEDLITDLLNRYRGESGVIDKLKKDTSLMQLYFMMQGEEKVAPVEKETVSKISESDAAQFDYFIEKLGKGFFEKSKAPKGVRPFGYAKTYLKENGAELKKTYRSMLADLYGFSDKEIGNVLNNTSEDQYLDILRRCRFYIENGGTSVKIETDYAATRNAILKKARELNFEGWVDNTFKGISQKRGIRNEKDIFTRSGERRSFDELHDEYNLNNAVTQMQREIQKGQSSFMTGSANVRGAAAKNYKTVDDIRADKSRLTQIAEDDAANIREEFSDRLYRLAQDAVKGRGINAFEAVDDFSQHIIDSLNKSKTKAAFERKMRSYPDIYKISDSLMADIEQLLTDMREAPVMYFEAKPQRAVSFDEVVAAIIPNNASEEIRQQLRNNGIEITEYDHNDTESRRRIVNDVADKAMVKFSVGNRVSASSLANDIINTYGVKNKITRADIAEGIENVRSKLYNTYFGKGDVNEKYAELEAAASETAEKIADRMRVVDENSKELYDTLRKEIKGTKISVSEQTKSDIPDWNDWKKANFGKLTISNDGIAVDSYYKELMGKYPQFFDETLEMTQADQLENIVNVLDKIKPREIELTADEKKAVIEEITSDIIDKAMALEDDMTSGTTSVRNKPGTYQSGEVKLKVQNVKQTEREKAIVKERAKLDEARKIHQKRIIEARAKAKQTADEKWAAQIDRLDERWQKEYNKKVEELDAKYGKQLDRQKQHEKDTVQKLRDKAREQKERARTRRSESDERKRLLKIAKRIQSMKMSESEKAMIPDIIAEIDTKALGLREKGYTRSDGIKVQGKLELQNLKNKIFEAQKNDPDYIPDPELNKKILRLDQKQIADMDISDVRDLIETVLQVEHEIKNNRKLLHDAKDREIVDVAKKSIDEIRRSRGVNKTMDTRIDKYTVTQLSPMRFARRISGYAEDSAIVGLFNDINEGAHKSLMFQMNASRKFDGLVRDKAEMKKFTGKNAELIDISKYDPEGRRVVITPAMRVSLYLHSKNYDNLRHIQYGGITIPDIKLLNKGNEDAYGGKAIRIQLSPSQVKEITSDMTDFEKAFADRAYTFFNEDTKKAVNETSLVLKGYEIATVENYFPLDSDDSFLQNEFESLLNDVSLENMGMLQERTHASNPVYLEDVISVITHHMKNVGDYSGLAIPIRNFKKVYKFTESKYKSSFKETLKKKWGNTAVSYIEQLKTDLQGKGKKGDFTIGLFGKYAQATLAVNVGVTLKQAASYPTAAAVLGWEPLTKAFTESVTAEDRKLMEKYTPLLWYRSKGYSITEMGDYADGTSSDWTKQGKVPLLMGWIQGADMATTTKLWKASEFYVRKHSPKLAQGTDAYYKRVAEIYNKVIEETQPNYTTMQRPDILRKASGNALIKALTMFKTQPMQNFNILYDAYGEFRARYEDYKSSKSKANKEAVNNAGKKLGLAIGSQLIAALVLNFFDGVGRLVKGQFKQHYGGNGSDDDGEITPESAISAYVQDNLSTLLGNAWFGSEAGTALAKMLGEYGIGRGAVWYDITAPELEMISNIISDFHSVITMFAKGKTNPWNIAKKLSKVAYDFAKIGGIPAKNISNILTGSYKNVMGFLKKDNIFDLLDAWNDEASVSATLGSGKKAEKYEGKLSFGQYIEYKKYYDAELEKYTSGEIRKKDGEKYSDDYAKGLAKKSAVENFKSWFTKVQE